VWPSPDDDDPLMRGPYPEWHLRSNVEQSLRRLGVERLATRRADLAFQLLIYLAVEADMDFQSARENSEGYVLTTAAMRWFWDN
jgi:hypothetical protein